MPFFFSVFYAPDGTEGGPSFVYPATMNTNASNTGGFQAEITSLSDNFPIENATIDIATVENPGRILEEIKTSASGLTPVIYLPAPPLEYSMAPSEIRPYSEYVLTISAPGYEPIQISGAEVLPGVIAKQAASLLPQSPSMPDTEEQFVIPDHTLYGEYPPKIVEEEVKEVASLGEIVLQNVVIPEFIVVHDGLPSNSNAKNYYVRYRDYIKNVASSEIYATWPESTIYANILAIQSFTLNRVYTEW
ncbi:MAG: carboxypeptidase regulatory-like domain-containing protein [Lachnospiraceae bacterium]